MGSVFVLIYDFFVKRKALLFGSFLASLCVLALLASKLEIQEDILKLFPQQNESAKLNSFLKESQFTDKVLVVVSQKDSTKQSDFGELAVFTDQLADSLSNRLKPYVRKVEYGIDESMRAALFNIVNDNVPVFLNKDDYALLDSMTAPDAIAQKLEKNRELLLSPMGAPMRGIIANDPIGINNLALLKFQSLNTGSKIGVVDGYFATTDEKNTILVITPSHASQKTKENTKFFQELDRVIEQLSQLNPDITANYFGAPVVAAGNSNQIRTDTMLTMMMAIGLLLLVFIGFFRNPYSPLLILVPLFYGLLFSMAAIYLIKGEISIISLGAGSLVLGIAVNYSLHFLTHISFHHDKRSALKELSLPMTAGSLTTIAGFLCLQFVDAPVLQDLGLYAAFCLVGAAAATLVFLPHMVSEKPQKSTSRIDFRNLFTRNSGLLYGNKKLAGLILLLTPVLLYFASDIRFETDMSRLNFMSGKTKEAESFVNKLTSFYNKTVFLVHSGETLEQALENSEATATKIVSHTGADDTVDFSNTSSVLPSKKEQLDRLRLWDEYWSQGKSQAVYETIRVIGDSLGFNNSAFESFIDQTERSYPTMSDSTRSYLMNQILNDRTYEKDGKVFVVSQLKSSREKSAEIVGALKQSTGTLHSSDENLFVIDKQKINEQLGASVAKDFAFIAVWTSLLVFVALLMLHGRIEIALISFLPMVVSWVWILGLMSLFDLQFNAVNIILSTLIFAIGDDFCIFTSEGLKDAYMMNKAHDHPSIASIALSAISTMIGIGVLVFAKHPAINSLALVSIIGIGSVWLMSQVLQPVIHDFFINRPARKKHEPFRFYSVAKSIFAFSYFVFGSLLISIIGFIMFVLVPFGGTGKRLMYNSVLRRFAWSMIYIMGNVKKQVFNETRENFSKPAVIIANHSSFLDILLLIMLHPKMILLTNKWVWNSPVFGMAIRFAEYYPVMDGVENMIPKLASKVENGYSIVVFPEGTRSTDGIIHRFHKGAFLLAQELKLDVVPILIHGADYTMTKGFFYLKNGQLSLKILPRIAFDDLGFGESVKDRAKLIGKYFREKHAEFQRGLETPRYFKEPLFSNYLFKGPVLEWYTKIKVRLENHYDFICSRIPSNASVVDIGCGYGYLSYTLGLTSRSRKILGIDYDSEKIEVARNGYLLPENVSFVCLDANSFQPEPADAFIMLDVLHYMEPDDQKILIEKCMAAVNSSGLIIIRDGITDSGRKHNLTLLSEWFSVKLLRFNKKKVREFSFPSVEWLSSILSAPGFRVEEFKDSKLTSNTTYIISKE